MQTERRETAASVGLLILRVGVGGLLATHGWAKLQMLIGGAAAQFGDPVGLGPTLSLALVTLSELACDLLIIAGLATRLAAIPPVIPTFPMSCRMLANPIGSTKSCGMSMVSERTFE